MLRPIRRVVTGHDADGRSVILSDETVTTAGELPLWPGCGVTSVWVSNTAPASNRDEDLPRVMTGFPPPGSGGVSMMIMHIPPEAELDQMSPETRKAVTIPVAHTFPEAMDIDTTKSYQMHATDTMDLLIVLQGEIAMMVDDGEVILKQFDTLIQRGVNHGWINRGKETALVASATLDARPLERKRPPKPKPSDLETKGIAEASSDWWNADKAS